MLERDARFRDVSLIGHSEGSLVGLIAAERDPHVHAFVRERRDVRQPALLLDARLVPTIANALKS